MLLLAHLDLLDLWPSPIKILLLDHLDLLDPRYHVIKMLLLDRLDWLDTSPSPIEQQWMLFMI